MKKSYDKEEKDKVSIKKNYKLLIACILGLILSGTGVYAVTYINAENVSYTNTSSGLSSTNLQDALDEAYNKCKYSWAKVGDYVQMTPTTTSYTTDTTYTGYSATQTITPSELNLWRVIQIKSDGTIEMVSESASSTFIYLNFIGYLNRLAHQYENTTYTQGSRIIGYNGQPEFLSSSVVDFSQVPTSTNTYEKLYLGGADALYISDMNLINTALGTWKIGKKYLVASRKLTYSSSGDRTWYGLFIKSDGSYGTSSYVQSEDDYFVFYDGEEEEAETSNCSAALRPIVTLKSGLSPSGSGTSTDPYVLG